METKYKDLNAYTRKELLTLPVVDYFERSGEVYKDIVFVPTNKKHSSGYSVMTIVGFSVERRAYEIISPYCDVVDLGSLFSNEDVDVNLESLGLSCDMLFKSKTVRVFSRMDYRFKVKHAGETVSFVVVK